MIVADASPLIALDRIGLIEVLPALYEQTVIVPPAVATEVLHSGHLFRAGRPSWLRERDPQDTALVASLKARVGPGESEAIALAIEFNSDLLIDERAGRRLASRMGIKVIGTAGALFDAKRYSLIPSLSAALEELLAVDFRLDSQIVDELLRAAGERKP